MTFPRIVSRKTMVLSRWASLLEKEVCFEEGAPTDVYHSISQAPYVGVFAMTVGREIPIVRQYRPAVEAYTWEFPGGTVDDGEDAASAAARELLEETGLRAASLHEIGVYDPDTGRLSVASSGFFARCADRLQDGSPEPALEVRYVNLAGLFAMVRAGEFRHQLHIALIASALLHGHISLPA